MCMIDKKWRMEMKLTANQIEIEYLRIFNQIELPKIYAKITDKITDKEYHAGTKNGVKYIKNIKAIVELINLYRKDFPTDWLKYLNYNFRESTKNNANELLNVKNISGFELLIKSWWGREIYLYCLKNYFDLYNLVSFDDYMKDIILNFLYLKNINIKWNHIQKITYLNNQIKEEEWDLMFENLVKKYKVDLTNPNFKPRNDFYDISFKSV